MVKVKVIKRFNDVSVKPFKIRKKDETFDVSEERAKYLVGQGMVEIVEEKKTVKPNKAAE